MIVDTSAIVAIHGGEQEREQFRELILGTRTRMSAASVVETFVVLDKRRPHASIDPGDLLENLGVEIVPFDAAQARAARRAYQRYGRGSGSPARLNLGDCFAYALASTASDTLLFKGEDFTHTDVLPAIRPGT